MSSFLSDAQKLALSQQFNKLHDTFARDVVVYKDAKRVIINTDPNYNYLYNHTGGTESVQNVPQKQTFKVRIQYSDNNNNEYFGEFNSATKIQRPDSRVRIKMKIEDYDYIKDAKRFEFDGRLFLLDSDPRFHGLFDVHFCTIYLKPIESK